MKMTGANDKTAHTTTIIIDLKDITSPVVVRTYNSTPALIKPNDGGATPKKKNKIKKMFHRQKKKKLQIIKIMITTIITFLKF